MDFRKKTFTLIELLVVIAIISILAAMLLPALKNARERGLGSACTGNLKQVGLVLSMYANDFNGFYPMNYNSDTGKTWTETLIDSGSMKEPKEGKASTLVCPAYTPADYDTRSFTYGFHRDATDAYGDGDGWIRPSKYVNRYNERVVNIPIVADTIEIANNKQWYQLFRAPAANSGKCLHLRHQGSAKAFMLDCSVRSLNHAALLDIKDNSGRTHAWGFVDKNLNIHYQ